MCIKSLRYLFIGIISILFLFAGSYSAQAQKNQGTHGEARKLRFAPQGAKNFSQCVNFEGGGSMFLTRAADGCGIKGGLGNVDFYKQPNCPETETPKKGRLVDVGTAQCTGTSYGCDECIKQSKNSPYIVEFWNGYEMVSYCFDFDGPPDDCNLSTRSSCIHSAQCLSRSCSGGECQ